MGDNVSMNIDLDSIDEITCKEMEDFEWNFTNNKCELTNFTAIMIKDCIPGGPDKLVASLAIQNETHHFDLVNCIWIKN